MSYSGIFCFPSWRTDFPCILILYLNLSFCVSGSAWAKKLNADPGVIANLHVCVCMCVLESVFSWNSELSSDGDRESAVKKICHVVRKRREVKIISMQG